MILYLYLACPFSLQVVLLVQLELEILQWCTRQGQSQSALAQGAYLTGLFPFGKARYF